MHPEVSKSNRRKFTRRGILKSGLTTALFQGFGKPAQAKQLQRAAPIKSNELESHGLCLNEDNSHFFGTRAGQRLDAEKVDAWVDQYAGTQVRELMLCPNCMRTSYSSTVWDPIWKGYDPKAGDDQPLLRSSSSEGRLSARKWIHTAWQLHQDEIDVYARWIRRARQQKISPWISMRMNDVHNVNDEQSYIHSEFWRNNPQLRRVPYRFSEWVDRAFDYGRPEVREYHMKLIRELAERYDFDGLELDWMRFGFHFQPGREDEGRSTLTQFTADVRKLLDQWEKKRGHKIHLGARVPSRPQTALGLGYDPLTWARRGLVDLLVVTPFFATAETDIPIELWKQLLQGTNVILAAGLELLLRGYPDSKLFQTNSLETVRGAATSLLDRGADRIYLFNYMDGETAIDDLQKYPTLLREAGKPESLSGKSRRHVLTFADTWAPGEPRAILLPAKCIPEKWLAFRIATGPKPVSGQIQARLGIAGTSEEAVKNWEIRVNGSLVDFSGEVSLDKPKPDSSVYAFQIPPTVLNRGNNLIEILPRSPGEVVWVEIAINS